jgi:hypothetical protein
VAQGEVEVFDGHLRVFERGKGERELQACRSGSGRDTYTPAEVEATQHFTQPARATRKRRS